MSKGGPEKIGEIMSRLLARTGYAETLASSVLEGNWEMLAGSHMARHSRPGKLRRGILDVMVRNSTVMHELSFKKKDILHRMQQSQTDLPIHDIRFRLGEVDL